MMPDDDSIASRIVADAAEIKRQLKRAQRAKYDHEFGTDGRFTVFRDGDGRYSGEDLLLAALVAYHFVLDGKIYERAKHEDQGGAEGELSSAVRGQSDVT